MLQAKQTLCRYLKKKTKQKKTKKLYHLTRLRDCIA